MPRRLKKTPEIYSIPAHGSFVDDLVRGIRARFGDDPLTLSDILILLPNRRAVRALREAFLRDAGGKTLLLPRMEPVGDVDEDDLLLSGNLSGGLWDGELAPPIPAHMRQMLLMDIIRRWYRNRGEKVPEMAQCAILARALGQFLDHVQTEQLSFGNLEKLVPAEYAGHWQQTLEFLTILTEYWPDILRGTGYGDVADRRNILLGGLRQKWLDTPPRHPVIAAGSTGSIPATAKLLAVIARLPQGMVVLPGLDVTMDEESWEAIDDTHPQATMKQLLDIIGTPRDIVENWTGKQAPTARQARHRLLGEVMRPAETTDRWRDMDLDLAQAARGLTRIEAPGPREEAGMIALMLREALESDGRTAALVTPDRSLARRVAAELKRWNILIDDSAGTPLANTPVGTYLRLSAQMVGEALAPVALLALLKHPLAAGGQEVGPFRKMVRLLEENILRGPRPGAGYRALARAIDVACVRKPHLKPLASWWAALSELIMPFEGAMSRKNTSFEEILTSHIAMAESLCATSDQSGAARLWRGEDGEAAARLITDLQQAAPHLPEIIAEDYPALLQVFMGDVTVRPKYGQHPRLHIWGPMEARLQQADMVILAGLNEGSWPAEVAPDPWMSRPMRKDFGLPSLERKIGLGAHDFIQAASAPEVVLTRSAKTSGTPTVPSRWLSRMDAIAPDIAEKNETARWLAWYRALDQPSQPVEISAPEPTPPPGTRPRQLSVTRIQKWMQDPYSIYARYILDLRVMDPLDADPGAADKGTIIHDALDEFMAKYPDRLPVDAFQELEKIGAEKFTAYLDRPTVRAFWWPRFLHVAEWFVETEKTRRQSIKTVATEVSGEQIFTLPGGPFTLTAKADRIDRLADGSYSIIDYKTGKSPTRRQIEAGYAPQLPLEGLILASGNFAGLDAGPVSELSYWQLKGGEEVAKITAFNDLSRNSMDVPAVIEAARDGLEKLVTTFDLVDTPYLNNPRPDNLGWGEYDHLARTKEWQGNDLSDISPDGQEKKP